MTIYTASKITSLSLEDFIMKNCKDGDRLSVAKSKEFTSVTSPAGARYVMWTVKVVKKPEPKPKNIKKVFKKLEGAVAVKTKNLKPKTKAKPTGKEPSVYSAPEVTDGIENY